MRSFTEPNGFCISSLAMMRTSRFGDSSDTSTTGVLPMRSSTRALTAPRPNGPRCDATNEVGAEALIVLVNLLREPVVPTNPIRFIGNLPPTGCVGQVCWRATARRLPQPCHDSPVRKYVIMGVQGSGKGTQAKLLSDTFDLVHIGVGDILRWHVQQHTKLGAQVKRTMLEGQL